MSFYRITLNNELAKIWKSKHHLSDSTDIRRIYRWVNFWGILNLKTNEWTVETREQLSTHPYLLEKVQFHTIQAPPPAVDDIWEEEIQMDGKTVWNGGLVTVCLSGAELKAWCSQESLELPEGLEIEIGTQPPMQKQETHAVHQTKYNGNKFQNKYQNSQNFHKNNKSFQKPQGGKCFIED